MDKGSPGSYCEKNRVKCETDRVSVRETGRYPQKGGNLAIIHM